jgi:hypothetical protein
MNAREGANVLDNMPAGTPIDGPVGDHGGIALLPNIPPPEPPGVLGTINSARFEALLDKLVAVQIDLEPICANGRTATEIFGLAGTIADACKVLHSAIADLRSVIHQIDGLVEVTEKAAA